MTEWIKCSERLPEDSTNVLFYVKEGEQVFSGLFCKEWHIRSNVFIENLECWDFKDDTITHWMLLPDAPEITDD